MYYIIYKITNQVNDKFYIGKHKTNDLNDNYMGSGKYLKLSQKKYGIHNFKKEILFVFDNFEDMNKKEAEIVNEEFLKTEKTYNLKVGGVGGFDYINNSKKNLYGKNGQFGYGRENLIPGLFLRTDLSEEYLTEIKRKISQTIKLSYKNGKINPFVGKSHTEETKNKIGTKTSKYQSGAGNSQYGTCWIFHDMFGAKKINKELISEYIDQGWILGRCLKFCKNK